MDQQEKKPQTTEDKMEELFQLLEEKAAAGELNEIDEADVVILAVAVGIEMEERFDEKRDEGKVIEVNPSEAIKNTAALIDRAEELAK